MAEYAKPWLTLEDQVARLESYGVELGDRAGAVALLRRVRYYRLTGYLFPFRESEQYVDDDGRARTRVLSDYRPGTTLAHAEAIIGSGELHRHIHGGSHEPRHRGVVAQCAHAVVAARCRAAGQV